MNILAIETTGKSASVAVINEEGEIFEETCDETLNHLKFLMPMVQNLLKKSNLEIDDLKAVAASEGPGSFTGIRIGVSSARALSQALDIRCIGVPTLETFLYNVESYKGIFCPIFDARRSQVYGGAYKWSDDNSVVELIEGKAYALSELLELLQNAFASGEKEVTFFGDGVEQYKAQIEEWQNISLNNDVRINFADAETRYQKASSVAKYALKLYKSGKVCQYNELKPNYMRKAEAERKLEQAKALKAATQN